MCYLSGDINIHLIIESIISKLAIVIFIKMTNKKKNEQEKPHTKVLRVLLNAMRQGICRLVTIISVLPWKCKAWYRAAAHFIVWKKGPKIRSGNHDHDFWQRLRYSTPTRTRAIARNIKANIKYKNKWIFESSEGKTHLHALRGIAIFKRHSLSKSTKIITCVWFAPRVWSWHFYVARESEIAFASVNFIGTRELYECEKILGVPNCRLCQVFCDI